MISKALIYYHPYTYLEVKHMRPSYEVEPEPEIRWVTDEDYHVREE